MLMLIVLEQNSYGIAFDLVTGQYGKLKMGLPAVMRSM